MKVSELVYHVMFLSERQNTLQ